jgi:adenosylcobinamide-phosphate synthase
MGAMALRLGVRLGKPGVYTLNAAGLETVGSDLARATAHAWRAVWWAAALCLLLAAVWQPWRVGGA